MNEISTNFETLVKTIKALRGKQGCPWDKKQTTESLRKYLIEEFDEILQAIDTRDLQNLSEELGDFLYLIIMISEINENNGTFSLRDVIDGINEKLIRRHPHVFSGTSVKDEKELRKQWNKIKAAEKAKKLFD
jgi:tetrapyrrole methylase family protein/MazG family protein